MSHKTHSFVFNDFNSHAHVERDRRNNYGNYHNKNFNSHAHVERDAMMISCMSFKFISTHTLTWSVTSKSFS